MRSKLNVITLLIIAIFICNNTFAQDLEWEQVLGPWDIPFVDGNTYIAVTSDDIIFATVKNLGIFRSDDNGESWTSVDSGLTSLKFSIITANSSNDIFVGTEFDGVFRSTDSGANWVEVDSGVDKSYVSDIAESPSGDLFLGTQDKGGMYRSSDNGSTWIKVNHGLNGGIRSLTIMSNGDVIAGTGSGVFISNDNGDNWSSLNSGIFSPEVWSIDATPDDNIFAGISEIGINNGIYLLRNIDSIWINVYDSLDLESPLVWSFITNFNADIYAGTEVDGVFRSSDGGENWSTVNAGLSTIGVRSLDINSEGIIFAGVSNLINTGGVFRTTTSTTSIQDDIEIKPYLFSLHQNHPNPFNPVTNISYSLPRSGDVSLIIYNLLGEKVARLVDGYQQAGEYNSTWNASNVSSGIYFYRLNSGDFTQTKKMVLLK